MVKNSLRSIAALLGLQSKLKFENRRLIVGSLEKFVGIPTLIPA